jgi:hypothetical protein
MLNMSKRLTLGVCRDQSQFQSQGTPIHQVDDAEEGPISPAIMLPQLQPVTMMSAPTPPPPSPSTIGSSDHVTANVVTDSWYVSAMEGTSQPMLMLRCIGLCR